MGTIEVRVSMGKLVAFQYSELIIMAVFRVFGRFPLRI